MKTIQILLTFLAISLFACFSVNEAQGQSYHQTSSLADTVTNSRSATVALSSPISYFAKYGVQVEGTNVSGTTAGTAFVEVSSTGAEWEKLNSWNITTSPDTVVQGDLYWPYIRLRIAGSGTHVTAFNSYIVVKQAP